MSKEYLNDNNDTPLIPGVHIVFQVGNTKRDARMSYGVVEEVTRSGYIKAIPVTMDDAGLMVKSDQKVFKHHKAVHAIGVPPEVQEEYMKVMADRQAELQGAAEQQQEETTDE